MIIEKFGDPKFTENIAQLINDVIKNLSVEFIIRILIEIAPDPKKNPKTFSDLCNQFIKIISTFGFKNTPSNELIDFGKIF